MLSDVVAVILAGGGGTRLWPVSTDCFPKPLCSFSSDKKTMLRKAIERIAVLIPREKIFVATNSSVAEKIISAIPDFPSQNMIIEPDTKDTAAAIGLAASLLRVRAKGSTMIVLTADHEIPEPKIFLEDLQRAVQTAQKGEYLVTIGIIPSQPSTEYGYIRVGKTIDMDGSVAEVLEFIEKPDQKRAIKLLDEGGALWNSGMFIWKIDTLMKAIKKYMPQLYEGLNRITRSIGTVEEKKVAEEVFVGLEKISIDYGIMQKVRRDDEIRIAVVKGDFAWSDLGNWNEMIVPEDERGNILIGDGEKALKQTWDCVIYNEGRERLLLFGLKHLIVANAGGATLVADRKKASQVKGLVESMRQDKDLSIYVRGGGKPRNPEKTKGETKEVDTEDCLILSDVGLVVALGVKGLVVARLKSTVAVAKQEHMGELEGFLEKEESEKLAKMFEKKKEER